MKTWNDLKLLMDMYDEEVWNLISEGGSRYSPNIEIGGGYDSYGESWGLDFYDEFFPFHVRADSMDEVINLAYNKLFTFYNQVQEQNITVHYIIDDKEIRPFCVDDCRKWRRLETKFVPYATKEEALANI